MTVVTVLHPGAMGAAVGRQAVIGGASVRWIGSGRSAATRKRAAAAGFDEFADLLAALDGTDIVLSICPPAAAEDLARELIGYTGVFVEANAITPARVARIAAMLPTARVVDGGIIGEPPNQAGTTRLYLSGITAGIPELFSGTALEVVTLPGGIGQASALKMAYASYQKASRVLAAVAHALAREYGVDDHLMREAGLLRSFPLADVEQFPAVAAKAWRWAPELVEVADVLRESGLPDELALGAAAALARWASAKDRDDLDVAATLSLLGQAPS
jgi:3-hydroxyisobutyrate dehydrogenase-like beta-hydroxyacid dehydrogenase